MKKVNMYEAIDGQHFKTEEECLTYEQLIEDTNAAKEMLWNGATLMSVLSRANMTRPWWDFGLSIEDKDILMRISKDTGFVVTHWQGSEKPVYKVCDIDKNGKILLHGDIGSCSSSYGNWISLSDLLRYARASQNIISST